MYGWCHIYLLLVGFTLNKKSESFLPTVQIYATIAWARCRRLLECVLHVLYVCVCVCRSVCRVCVWLSDRGGKNFLLFPSLRVPFTSPPVSHATENPSAHQSAGNYTVTRKHLRNNREIQTDGGNRGTAASHTTIVVWNLSKWMTWSIISFICPT